jgi:hypothetical protein
VSDRRDLSVFTLAEPHYYTGVATLLNSLVSAGFGSQFTLYHRGPLPDWWVGAQASLMEHSQIELRAESVEDEGHLAVLKPKIAMLELERNPHIGKLVYLDPDIVVIGEWTFFETWATFGVAVVEDVVHFRMTERHPLRLRWNHWAESRDIPVVRAELPYFNSGFFSVGRESQQFLLQWMALLDLAQSEGHDPIALTRTRTNLFSTWDQDLMNIALSTCEVPVSYIGPEGMGFLGSGYTMLHGVGNPKPWARPHVRMACRGVPPRQVDSAFVRALMGPIRPLNGLQLALLRVRLAVAKSISRIVRR